MEARAHKWSWSSRARILNNPVQILLLHECQMGLKTLKYA